ncbi:LysR family transcriptional regulator [Celeribacter neptunius]|uniref:Transcriptional regulator n=1 Tax=Celeribacter neptunius TaxID=588602 RepID=A0A1I3TIY3_9RHOB|nr:LysR family transcriptional regulator [Celeribacter neptunius]SFJ70369.1 transcriptional regulator [Celeribacter neptunius]
MLSKLEMFIAVAKEGHFGRAAQSLGITQPSLSTGIKQLEDQLGVQLIFRGSRFGGLTPEGQRALTWARKITADSRQLRDEMRATKHGLSGQLRLAAIPTALTWAATLSTAFTQAHPNVQMTILSRPSMQILTMLDDLEADAGLTYLDNEPLGRVSTVPLYEERYMVVAAPGNALSGRARLHWSDLAEQPLCLLSPDMQNRRIIDRNLNAVGVLPRVGVESNSTVVLIAHVESGGWITVLPEGIARFLTEGKPLELIPLEGGEVGHRVGLIAPHRDPNTPVLAALLAEAGRMSAL